MYQSGFVRKPVLEEGLSRMKYQAIPLIYAANEHFKNTIRFAVEFNEDIDPASLIYAVEQVQKRYPYFSVKIEKEGEAFTLAENDLPFVIAADEKPVCLNSTASNGHLLAFARKDRTVWVDVSHFICDGNGLAPLVKTLVCYYEEHRYGIDGIDTGSIRLVTDKIDEEEYLYPFPETPIPNTDAISIRPREYTPFFFEDSLFDDKGNYAYNLQIPQKDLMRYAKSGDGSPVSFISVMLFEALMDLYPETDKDIVFQIPHEYRKVLNRPLSHDCLARVFPVKLAAKDRNKSLEMLNISVRGQIVLGSDESADIEAINGMLKLNAYMQTLPLEGKKQAMLGLVAGSLKKGTFGVSYTGNISWGGLEKHIRDIHLYAGENGRHDSLGVELFTLGDVFSLCLMQPGKNPAFVRKLIQSFARHGIECRLMSEERYQLADYKLP